MGTTSHTTGLQHRVDLFPTFWGEPVSAFHGRMGYSANMWLHHLESLRPEDQPPEIRLSGCESFLSMTQVVSRCPTSWGTLSPCRCFASSRSASASASSASPAAPQLPVDASPDAFPEPVQTMVWRCRGLCMDCKKACCGKSDEDYDKVKWHKNHRCNYCWTVWKAEHQ